MSALRTVLFLAVLSAFACGTQTPDPIAPPTTKGPVTYSMDPRDKPAPVDRTLYFYYGPMKHIPGEVLLHSITAVTGHSFGAWDFTAPDPAMNAFATAGNAAGRYYQHCRFFGGCMEHRIPLGRTSFVGTAYVLELERAVVEGCGNRAVFGMFPNNRAPTGTTLVIEVIRHQYLRAFGEQPSDADLDASMAYFDSHLRAPETTGISALESAGRGHCRALLTTNRFLYY